jgi:murein DD-endopeptidase MepM/ murein hydrolase activator NlpD
VEYNKKVKHALTLSSFALLSLISSTHFAFAAASEVIISPETILQGDPILVTIKDEQLPQKITFGGEPISVFRHKGYPAALVGVDLKKPAGNYNLRITLPNGEQIVKLVRINEREKQTAPLGIPTKLGGNTTASAANLVNTLAKENAILNTLKTGTKAFWSEKFQSPVANPIITDIYGYTRDTVGYSIAHKGTDFRAPEGTKVFAMNRGVVRLARTFRNYGKTVVVDHGLGLQTLYMHLSRIHVNEGELVLPGQLIGRSGQTGYAEKPHLHLSVKISGISIDPVKFLALFGESVKSQ